MGAVTSTANDLLSGALRQINQYAAGESLDPNDAGDALQVLNDLLESLSTDKLYVYTANESIVQWTPGQFQYSIGNPVAAQPFAATVTGGSALLTGVTNVANLSITFGYNAAQAYVGGTLTDVLGLIPANTTIVSVDPLMQTVTMSQAAIASSTGQDQVSYTVPGNFAIARPLRLRPGYTRITANANTGLDYWFDVCSLDDYNEIGYKGVPGPWPYLVCYQPTFPYGTLWVYPNPQVAGQVYLWTDVILAQLTSLTQTIQLPQGYARSIKKLLALELCPEYGKVPTGEMLRQAQEARTFIKNLNMTPVKKLRFDSAIMSGNGRDASFIFHGGFGSNL